MKFFLALRLGYYAHQCFYGSSLESLVTRWQNKKSRNLQKFIAISDQFRAAFSHMVSQIFLTGAVDISTSGEIRICDRNPDSWFWTIESGYHILANKCEMCKWSASQNVVKPVFQLDKHWFQYGSGSESRVLMTKNWKKCTAEIKIIFFTKIARRHEKPSVLKREHPALQNSY